MRMSGNKYYILTFHETILSMFFMESLLSDKKNWSYFNLTKTFIEVSEALVAIGRIRNIYETSRDTHCFMLKRNI